MGNDPDIYEYTREDESELPETETEGQDEKKEEE